MQEEFDSPKQCDAGSSQESCRATKNGLHQSGTLGGGGTLPMFGYMGAAGGLKSWPCLGQKYSKNPTLCMTTASISRPCLGQERKYFLHVIQDKETRPTNTICSVNVPLL